MKVFKRKCGVAWLRFLLVFVAFHSTSAFTAERQNLFDWYYSAVFGTGSYRIGERDVFVASYSYQQELREASDDEYGIHFNFPIALGFYDYEPSDAIDFELPSDVATITLFPGAYYIIPLSADWTIKPFINLGYGKEFEGGTEAWIYSVGVRSLYKFRLEKWRMAIGSSLYYAGNTREDRTDLGFAAADIAWDFNHPTSLEFDDKIVYLGGYLAAYYFSDLEFISSNESTFELNDQYEVGITMSTQSGLEILGFELERVGLAYLTSQNFDAWRLSFSFPY